MFEEELENLTDEEQKEVGDYFDEYLDSVAIGNGDYRIGPNGEIIID